MLKVLFFIILCWGCKGWSQNFNHQQLLSACAKKLEKEPDPACQKALQLNNLAENTLEQTLTYLRIKEYANTMGAAIGLMVTQKGSLPLWEKKSTALNADCNFREQSIIFNFSQKF